MKHLLFALAVVIAAPLHAAPASLQQVSAYLNSLGSAKANFVQINADGSRSSGTLFIKKPGRARFEYDAPNDDALVIAGGGQVAVFDSRASGKPEQYPLSRTPLKLILDRNIDLTRTNMVVGHAERDGRTVIVAQDPAHPEYGRIQLYFEPGDLRLSEWLIISESGEQTRVSLGPLVGGVEMSPFLFDISYETSQRR
ncbi:LolA family protein [Qingshengfaniella alkalisoli]|uniref:Outer membrane lipoprotein carrier protein LolA n=1 Tax=Qingshengfaniella alkalisoli TaxID=2599296 RepID=A0A5B8I742_9RHOB|nr:outer membrane lipoprotein carrier protein LolA [Qingshengfaniella alkalisoli]QDY68356.1 outer membrane lipoprotein carrier protein LolA [Qingshengfaniella alkalisoli]